MNGTSCRKGIVLLALACGLGGVGRGLSLAAEPESEGERTAVEVAAADVDGEALFLVNCRVCHGTKGTAGTPLAHNENLADARHVARTIIIGPGYMTAFGDHLDDEQIAAVATYVRSSWGNSFGAVDANEVAAAR